MRPRKLTDEARAEIEREALKRLSTLSDKELARKNGVTVRAVQSVMQEVRKLHVCEVSRESMSEKIGGSNLLEDTDAARKSQTSQCGQGPSEGQPECAHPRGQDGY